ncbi:MAG: DUF4268 domain-containing protein [Pricia sp.]|nr:DUF4268 domain-containing protein [Pricia sp.]
MFSKTESKRLRQDFWIAFGKSFPKKWILYNTKIKGLVLKFHFDLKKAMVSLDIDTDNFERRIALWEKLLSLKPILQSEDYLPEVQFDEAFILENGKEISRIYVELHGISIHNKDTWLKTMEFFNNNMTKLEAFFLDYRDYIEIR